MIEQWALKHGVSAQALLELRHMLGAASQPEYKHADATTEAGVKSRERLLAAKTGGVLWRNNSGAFKDEQGNFIRYGLCNDSKKVNDKIKSADLIGIMPVTVTERMIGQTIGQFTAIETKKPGWVFKNTEREQAQLKFLQLVDSLGGYARFSS